MVVISHRTEHLTTDRYKGSHTTREIPRSACLTAERSLSLSLM